MTMTSQPFPDSRQRALTALTVHDSIDVGAIDDTLAATIA
jgi:hypothetical protein